MSTTATATLDSQLSATWSPNSYPDASVVMPGYVGRLWAHDCLPHCWSKYQVWDWLQQFMDIHQVDASSIPLLNFDIDGRQLCNMSYQDFIRAAGSVGPILFQSLAELKWNGQMHGDIVQVEMKPTELDFVSQLPEANYTYEMYDCPVQPLAPVASPTLLSPDIKRSYNCPNQAKKHNPRGTHLWEFIRDILLNPERHPGLIKWEDRAEGVFRFLKSEAVAQLWGKKKNNSSMTYEKLSRAMRARALGRSTGLFFQHTHTETWAFNLTRVVDHCRYYYKREILERVDGRRLVYKFGRNARGWSESEKGV